MLQLRVDGDKRFRPLGVELLAYTQELDLRRRVLERRLRFRDEQGRTTSVASRRLVSMHEPHLAAIETTFTAEDWSGRIEIRSALDGAVVNAGVKRYASPNSKHLEPVESAPVDAETIFLRVRTA